MSTSFPCLLQAGSSSLLSVVMPAYNEEDYIVESVCETVRTFSAADLDFEIVVVDDGSVDATVDRLADLVRRFPDNVRAYSYSKNRGKGFALLAGAINSRGATIAFLDADLELHPDQLVGMIEIMSATASDVVIGSKWHPNSTLEYPFMRRVYSRSYYALVRALFAFGFRDTQTGVKLFRAEPLLRALPRMLNKQYAFDLELLSVIHRLGYAISEAPVTIEFKRSIGRIKWADAIAMLRDTLAIFYRLKILRYYDQDHHGVWDQDLATLARVGAKALPVVSEHEAVSV